MLAGRPPFSGESALDVGAAHVRDVPVSVSSLCVRLLEEIARLVHHLLEKAPIDRPSSAAVVGRRLDTLLSTIETTPEGGRARVATITVPPAETNESIELAETVGVTRR